MDIKTFEDIRRVHDRFADVFAARMQALASAKPGAAVDPAKERAAQLEAVKEKMQALAAARDAATQRFDDELARYRRQAEDLEQAKMPEQRAPKEADAQPVGDAEIPAPPRARKAAAAGKAAKPSTTRKSTKK